MTRSLPSLLLLLLWGAFGVMAYRVLRTEADAGKGMPAYSVYSEERNGLGETYRLVRQLGWTPVAMTRPIQHTHARGLLILVEPEQDMAISALRPGLTETDARSVLRWVAAGNTLLLCSRDMNEIHHQLKVFIDEDSETASEQNLTTAVPGAAGGYTARIDRLAIEGDSTIRSSGSLPLWWQGDKPGAVLLGHGRGRVLVVADPSLLTRRGLRREDNVLFLYNVCRMDARQGRVYFDEYHHGLHSAGGVGAYLRYHGWQWTLLQLLWVAGVVVWAAAIRLGPVRPRPRPASADAVEYASAVARIYQQAGVRQLLSRTLVRDFTAMLTRHLHLRRTALPAEMLAAWQRRYGQDATASDADRVGAPAGHRLHDLLRIVARLRRGDGTERQLLTWARALDEFKSEVQRVR